MKLLILETTKKSGKLVNPKTPEKPLELASPETANMSEKLLNPKTQEKPVKPIIPAITKKADGACDPRHPIVKITCTLVRKQKKKEKKS